MKILEMREGEPFRSLCTQVKRGDLVVVITSLSLF